MQIEGLIPFKSSIDQEIAPLYFLRISNSFCSSCSVNAAEIITGFAFFSSKKHTLDVWVIPLRLTLLSLFMFLLLPFHYCMSFLYRSNSN